MKRTILFILTTTVLAGLIGCAATQTTKPSEAVEAERIEVADPIEKINEIRDWFVSDIWNLGATDIEAYVETGKSATDETLDIAFTLEQLEKAMQKKPDYDAYMDGLTGEYAEIGELWGKVSKQIDAMYVFVQENEIVFGGGFYDLGLLRQYFPAFDEAVYKLTE